MDEGARFVMLVDDHDVAPCWHVGPTTYAMDRYTPDVELIYQTPFQEVGGRIDMWTAGDREISLPIIPSSRRQRLSDIISKKEKIEIHNKYYIDMRENNYFNWSHHINNYLLISLMAKLKFCNEMHVVLPKKMPSVLYDVYDLFGFKVIQTNGIVEGRRVFYKLSNINLMQAASAEVVEICRGMISNVIDKLDVKKELRKVYISRKGGRSISNEREVESFLFEKGFVKLFAEDLSASQQISLWCNSSHVVTVHGAAIAPLRLRNPRREPIHLVEICPVGHMTRFFQSICSDVSGRYVGVRGRYKPEYIRHIYGDKPFLKYSLDNFSVDIKSLELALYLIDGGEMKNSMPREWLSK